MKSPCEEINREMMRRKVPSTEVPATSRTRSPSRADSTCGAQGQGRAWCTVMRQEALLLDLTAEKARL